MMKKKLKNNEETSHQMTIDEVINKDYFKYVREEEGKKDENK
jgi:hypothetical protein